MPHGYADGGMPYDNGIPFDPTAGGIAPGTDQFNVDPSVNAIAQDILNGSVPLRKSAGFDRGIAGPQDASPLDTANWPSGPINSPGVAVRGDQPSPLDNAAWPSGPVNSPGPIVDGNGPSPLDTAAYPSGPIGAPDRFVPEGDREKIVGQPSFDERFNGEPAPSRISPSLADQGVSGASVPLGVLKSPGFGGSPSVPVTGMKAIPLARANDIATPTAGYADNMVGYDRAIKSIEGGNYGAVGPETKTGDHAYGAHQVMGANIPKWTKEVLGTSMTPTQFLKDPQAQDIVFRAKYGQYVNKYGPEGAAKAWFAGEHGMNNPNAKDVNGMTVAEYGNRFKTALNGGAGSASGPNGVAGGDIPPKAMLTQSTPENTGVAAPSSGIDFSSNSKLWPALMAAGAGMMSSRSPFLGNAVGEGIQSGMGQYSAEKQQEMKQHQIDLEAKRLSQQADFQQKELALKNLPYSQMTEYQKAQIASTDAYRKALGDRSNFRPSGAMTEDGHPIHTDTRTGESIDAITGEPVAAGAKVIPSGRGGTGATGGVWKFKHDAWLAAHPGDENGALDYAANKRSMNPSDMNKAALTMARGDVNADVTLIGDKNAAKRDQLILEKAAKYEKMIREGIMPMPAAAAAPGAPGTAPAAPAAVPPKAPVAAAPVNAAAAAPAKSPFVRQNGYLYNLQSDGSYKEVQ